MWPLKRFQPRFFCHQLACNVFYHWSASTASRLAEFFLAWLKFQKILTTNTYQERLSSSSPIKLEFWGQTIWGPWRIWVENDLREQKWFDLTLKKSFICVSISPKLSGQFLTWLENNFIKCRGRDIPNITATPIFSANLPWHATGTHCFLSMISLHSLEAFNYFFGMIHISKKINFQHISIQKHFHYQQ